MRPIGFSTGALAKSDFALGLRRQAVVEAISAVELSALRDYELEPLVRAAYGLDVSRFRYVSFHAPSKLGALSERDVVSLLKRLPGSWPVVVHPEIALTPELWRDFGDRLCLENMDNRKTSGRTVDELREVFAMFPEASFCLDLGHAKQLDPTMTTAILMVREFGSRLKQVHVSDVGSRGEHLPLGVMAKVAFAKVAPHIPTQCPLIIESVLDDPTRIRAELNAVRTSLEAGVSFATIDSIGWPACQLV